jgi:hypothetical protein
LPVESKLLILASCFLFLTLRAGIAILGFNRLRKHQGKLGRCLILVPRPSKADVVWAVETAGRHKSCLLRALVAELLLKRAGCPTALRIGVARGSPRDTAGENSLAAHAWIECEGEILFGDVEDGLDYVALPEFK